MEIFVTVTGYKHYFGNGVFNIGEEFILYSEPQNEYDKYAVAVYSEKYGKCGYIANSPKTAAFGTVIAKTLADTYIEGLKITIRFIAGDYIIASFNNEAVF